ncbi:DUF4910 domain-containing protein [Thermococcus argininiproducens]|uniref:DUF4910 domain-containing protein n=1 Tax=Thermococcus argininiproducens TaxID=2866384 RepID=A0A9E7MAB3_9EURY|nr:DUF4910 domain-containing protein [Thermococcus argininiproducens]USH00285.1 DUF4910 domain-containing protein [Thermococcus argininiproducens]
MREFLKESDVFDAENVINYIGEISKFHRIQGSKELVEAARYILEELRINGIKAELLEEVYDGEKWHLTLASPIPWDLVYGEIKIDKEQITTSKTPLIVMAHSPPGDVEGEVIAVDKEEDWKEVKGKVVLIGEKWYENYKKANENGAIGFIAYKKGTGKAFPYIGLFLTKNDLKWAKIPAVTLSEKIANKIIQKLKKGEKIKVKLKVESVISEKQTLPLVYAKIGSPPYILFTAHMCHPKPGANDNASGAAMLIELARVLKEFYNNSFRFGFAFLWIPEHYGTQAFIENWARLEEYYAVINLDMVGGSEDRSGSTIMIIKTPLSRFSIISGLLEYFINLANSEGESFGGSPLPKMKAKSYPYEMGSDHDVFNIFGIPSVMPITWPDKFYHSSEDSIEKISKEILEIIGKAVLATSLALSKGEINQLKRFARAYTMKYLGELNMEKDLEVAEKLVMNGLNRDSDFLGINLGHELKSTPWLKWQRKGIISTRSIRQLDEKKGTELAKILEDRKIGILLHELLMLGEMLSEEETYNVLKEEFGEIDREKLEKALEILKSLDIVSF